MSKSDTRGENPNATIQLSALDAEQLVQFDVPEATEEGARPSRSRAAPPPLPPTASLPAPRGPATLPTKAPNRALTYAGLFVVLLAGAIGAGLAVGMYARSHRAAPQPPGPQVSQSSPAATTAAAGTSAGAPAAPSSSAPHAMVIPTVEVSAPAQ